MLSVVALFLALFELGDFWGLGISQIFDWETLPIDNSVDAIGIAYAGLSGVRNQIQ